MSAPAGWYPQPDGRQRYWDGAQWTEHFHDATPQPAADAGDQASTWTAEAGANPVADAPHVQSTYGAPSASTLGQPGQPGQPGQQVPATPAYGAPPAGGTSGSSGLGKGCLIAGIVGLVVVALVVVAGIFIFNRAADEVKSTMDRVASASPEAGGSDGSVAPTPEDGVTVQVGKSFSVGDLKVAEGWAIKKQDGIDFWTMEPTLVEPTTSDTILEVSARNGDQEIDNTICTATKGASKLNCLPFTEDVSGATSLIWSSAF